VSTATMISGTLHRERRRNYWVRYYTTIVSLLGFFIAINALLRYDSSWTTLAILAGAAIISELTSVCLFRASHSSVSIVTVATIAAIVLLGPWGGVLVAVAGALMTILTTSEWFNRSLQSPTRAKWWRRIAFNVSLRVVGAAFAGSVFIWVGGTPGTIDSVWVLPIVILTVLADELVSTFLLIGVIHLQTGRAVLDIWRQDWQWTYPITVASGVIGGGGIAMIYEMAGSVGLGIFMLPILATGYALRLYLAHTRSYVDQLEIANHKLEEANLGLLQTLAAVVDAYDIYTFGHSAQVARYAAAIAKEMGLSQEEQTKIYRGGLIHDVGKVGVTDAIIGKKGRLTDEEYAALKLHTVIGADIVSQMPQFQELVPLVRNHHERWDGYGYPDGLKGEENALGARIMCVADSVEAMLSDRPYQATRTLEAVVEEVVRCSGAQFDPQVVTAFLHVVKQQGDEFFVNSASAVARDLAATGALNTLDGLCYVKKSMIAQHLQATVANATCRSAAANSLRPTQ